MRRAVFSEPPGCRSTRIWIISPEDRRVHGLDERIPIRAMYDNVVDWEMMLRQLARNSIHVVPWEP